MGEKLTKEDIKKIEKEIEHRKLEERPRLIEAVKEARAQGDLSENFEYYAAKREKNQNESRIGYLEGMLKTAEIVSDTSEEGEAGLDKKVEVRFVDRGTTETYKIVTPIRSDSLKKRISIESPIGMALVGHKPGEKVNVKTPGGVLVMEILSVQDDDENDEIRAF
jgi:transcription elongation factor GreA